MIALSLAIITTALIAGLVAIYWIKTWGEAVKAADVERANNIMAEAHVLLERSHDALGRIERLFFTQPGKEPVKGDNIVSLPVKSDDKPGGDAA